MCTLFSNLWFVSVLFWFIVWCFVLVVVRLSFADVRLWVCDFGV